MDSLQSSLCWRKTGVSSQVIRIRWILSLTFLQLRKSLTMKTVVFPFKSKRKRLRHKSDGIPSIVPNCLGCIRPLNWCVLFPIRRLSASFFCSWCLFFGLTHSPLASHQFISLFLIFEICACASFFHFLNPSFLSLSIFPSSSSSFNSPSPSFFGLLSPNHTLL